MEISISSVILLYGFPASHLASHNIKLNLWNAFHSENQNTDDYTTSHWLVYAMDDGKTDGLGHNALYITFNHILSYFVFCAFFEGHPFGCIVSSLSLLSKRDDSTALDFYIVFCQCRRCRRFLSCLAGGWTKHSMSIKRMSFLVNTLP